MTKEDFITKLKQIVIGGNFSGGRLPRTLYDIFSDLTDLIVTGGTGGTATKESIGLGNVDNTSDINKPVSTAVQVALNTKQNSLGFTPYNASNPQGFITASDVNASVVVKSVAGKTGIITLVKADVGLNLVDNTSDLSKPISTAVQTQLDTKVPSTRTINGNSLSSNITIDKASLGLANVDNTSDSSKPISSAIQSALDNKVPNTRLINGTPLTSDIILNKNSIGLNLVNNTSDANKPISTATQTALDGKLSSNRLVNGKSLTADITLNKADIGLANVDNTTDTSKPISTATQSALTAITTSIGTLASLTTTVKTSIVNAINELKTSINTTSIKTRRAVTSSTSIISTDYMISYVSIPDGGANVVLGSPTSLTNQRFIIKDEDGTGSINPIGVVGTLNGASNPTVVNIDYGKYEFYSTGTSWIGDPLPSTSGTPTMTKLVGTNTHYGQGNSSQNSHPDYTTASIPYAIQCLQSMGMNAVREGVNLSNTGGVYNNSFSPFVAACNAANIQVLATLSATAGSTAAAAGPGLYTQTEYNNFKTSGYNKAFPFATAYKGKISSYCLGAEMDNFIFHISSGSGAGEPAAPTGSPLRWTSNSSWTMDVYGGVLYYIAGMYQGVKAADPSVKVMLNYSWIHYGLFMRFCDDLKNIFNITLDSMGLDWYNDNEYGTDTSHNVFPTDVSMGGDAMNRINLKFVQSGRVSTVGFAETGFNPTKANPNSLNTGSFVSDKILQQYWTQADFIYIYQLFLETNARAGSTSGEQLIGIQDATNPTFSSSLNTISAKIADLRSQ